MELIKTAGPQINFAVVDLGSNTIRMTLYAEIMVSILSFTAFRPSV